ncbi:CHASE2 domain-containing protein [Cupriavidus basilensis]|uniref:CHASE2 domain-containing protein n=1 Tax=Cupriavidus basilensis TaxID=68895 RepID=UPI0023E89564|nr:adenylate/guanylate cyclase domain-containing protein [Cupriavidus basilensis]MDF3886704.1 adenylate/guanylate cyclase domain-containing protein [Cupriavidus basilensis]
MVALRRISYQDAVRWLVALLAVLLVVMLGTGRWSPAAYWRVVNLVDDWRHRVTASALPAPHVAIVDIDERSLAAIGPWPWPRTLQARLITYLFERDRVAAVGLDILFPEVETVGPGDAQLQDLARRYPLVFAQAFDFSAPDRATSTGNLSGAIPGDVGPLRAPRATGYVGNFFVAHAVPCTGHVTTRPDPDGTVRSISPFIVHAGAAYPMLALQMIRCGQAWPQSLSSELKALAGALPPSREAGFIEIPFRRSRNGFKVISALDVITGEVPLGRLTGRYVLVGSSALGLSDRISSPIDPWLPGVIVHAQLLDALLSEQESPAAGPDLAWMAWLWAGASIVLFAIIFRTQKAWFALCILLAASVAWCATAILLSTVQYHLRIDLPLVVAAVFLLVLAPFEWISAQSRARAFETRFGRYLPPAVLRELLEQGNVTAFEPKRHLITVLFVDIVGYTSLAEDMQPEELVALTDTILSRLTEHVYATEGTLDKYIGDALMAIWGAPVPREDHADLAITCARAMIDGMDQLNAELARANPGRCHQKPIHVRVGVNSGDAVVGEIGSAVRRSYTAIGDSVNIAARLQDFAKEVDHDLLIGARTAELCHSHALQPFVCTTLRGRSQQEVIYVPAAPDEIAVPAHSVVQPPFRQAA